jgi:pimeloyl-ACP methyl ester carboxylesterase
MQTSTDRGPTLETQTHDVPGARITYDVRGPLPPADEQPVLLLIGQPMTASGFGTLASHFADRTVLTYDPRGLGRSTRSDGRTDNDPRQQAEDLHALIATLGTRPVDLFGSSGGAVTGLALVTAHPEDVRTLVAHEPPVLPSLPDADRAVAAFRGVQTTYQQSGWGAGMAAFIAFASWEGEFPDDYANRPAPDPAQFGMPSADDGSRDDPLLSSASDAVSGYRLDVQVLRTASTRIVIAVGEDTGQAMTARASAAAAEQLGLPLTVFPGGHGGFLGDEYGQQGKPDAFAARLRLVLDEG